MKKFKCEIIFLLWILTIVLMCMIMSCTTSKQLHQEKVITKTEITTDENTVSKNETVSFTKITEKKDTSTTVPGVKASVAAKYSSLLKGDTVYATGEGLTLKTFYDSLTKTVKSQATVAPRSVAFLYDKVTEKKETSAGTIIANKQQKQNQAIQSEKKDKEVERSGIPWWFIVIAVIILACIVIYFVIRRRIYFKDPFLF